MARRTLTLCSERKEVRLGSHRGQLKLTADVVVVQIELVGEAVVGHGGEATRVRVDVNRGAEAALREDRTKVEQV